MSRRVMSIMMRVKVMIMNMDMNVRMTPHIYTMTPLFIGQASRPAHQSSVDIMTLSFIGQTDRRASPLWNIQISPLTLFLD